MRSKSLGVATGAKAAAKRSQLSTERQGLAKEYAKVLRRLRDADGLWRYWKGNDICENDELWAEFTNAVYAHLDGKPVPKKFIKP